MAKSPQLADIQCRRIVFQPGDRIIVRTRVALDRSQERKLRRAIEKWAGVAVEVLIINVMQMDIEIDPRNSGIIQP